MENSTQSPDGPGKLSPRTSETENGSNLSESKTDPQYPNGGAIPGPSGVTTNDNDGADAHDSGSDSDDSVEIIEIPKKPIQVICISDSDSEESKNQLNGWTDVTRSKEKPKKKKAKSLQERLEDNREKLFPVKKEDENNQSPGNKQESTCSICLGSFDNKAFLDQCFHLFCYTCILQWANVVHTCPLCKSPFKSIIHDITPDLQYQQHFVSETKRDTSQASLELGYPGESERRFRYRSTLVDRYNQRREYENQQRHRERYRTYQNQQRRYNFMHNEGSKWAHSAATQDRRRMIYRCGMVIQEVQHHGRLRYRDISVEFLRSNPALTHRLVPWILRDLNVLLHNNNEHISFVLHFILSLLTRIPLECQEFHDELQPFLFENTSQFIKELVSFASSPYDMRAYDERVVYDVPSRQASNRNGSSHAALNAARTLPEREITMQERLMDEAFTGERREPSPPLARSAEPSSDENSLVNVEWNSDDSDIVVTKFVSSSGTRAKEQTGDVKEGQSGGSPMQRVERRPKDPSVSGREIGGERHYTGGTWMGNGSSRKERHDVHKEKYFTDSSKAKYKHRSSFYSPKFETENHSSNHRLMKSSHASSSKRSSSSDTSYRSSSSFISRSVSSKRDFRSRESRFRENTRLTSLEEEELLRRNDRLRSRSPPLRKHSEYARGSRLSDANDHPTRSLSPVYSSVYYDELKSKRSRYGEEPLSPTGHYSGHRSHKSKTRHRKRASPSFSSDERHKRGRYRHTSKHSHSKSSSKSNRTEELRDQSQSSSNDRSEQSETRGKSSSLSSSSENSRRERQHRRDSSKRSYANPLLTTSDISKSPSNSESLQVPLRRDSSPSGGAKNPTALTEMPQCSEGSREPSHIETFSENSSSNYRTNSSVDDAGNNAISKASETADCSVTGDGSRRSGVIDRTETSNHKNHHKRRTEEDHPEEDMSFIPRIKSVVVKVSKNSVDEAGRSDTIGREDSARDLENDDIFIRAGKSSDFPQTSTTTEGEFAAMMPEDNGTFIKKSSEEISDLIGGNYVDSPSLENAINRSSCINERLGDNGHVFDDAEVRLDSTPCHNTEPNVNPPCPGTKRCVIKRQVKTTRDMSNENYFSATTKSMNPEYQFTHRTEIIGTGESQRQHSLPFAGINITVDNGQGGEQCRRKVKIISKIGK